MKINHTVSSIDKSTGGPARSVTHLMSKILHLSQNISLDLTTVSSKEPIINSFNTSNSNIYFYEGKIKFNGFYDLYHAHGIWLLPMHKMAVEARKKNKPYIITTRGMLEPWSLKQKSFKKKISLMLYQYKDLKNAACLHATANMELESLRALGLKNPIAMIPNGINLDEFPNFIPKKPSGKKKMLFLSRIHYKKGIEILIEAWLKLDQSIKDSWILEIVGNGEEKYIEQLNLLIRKNKLENEIYILKPVFGLDKIKIYREASLFVLPTFSENFGVVIAEALASYVPVITTKGSPWKDIEENNCGRWIDIGVEPLKGALENMMQKDEKQLIEMGVRGRYLIENQFSIESVAKKMIELYSWILKDNKEVPDFVEII